MVTAMFSQKYNPSNVSPLVFAVTTHRFFGRNCRVPHNTSIYPKANCKRCYETTLVETFQTQKGCPAGMKKTRRVVSAAVGSSQVIAELTLDGSERNNGEFAARTTSKNLNCFMNSFEVVAPLCQLWPIQLALNFSKKLFNPWIFSLFLKLSP